MHVLGPYGELSGCKILYWFGLNFPTLSLQWLALLSPFYS
jgi:hypothetical protein